MSRSSSRAWSPPRPPSPPSSRTCMRPAARRARCRVPPRPSSRRSPAHRLDLLCASLHCSDRVPGQRRPWGSMSDVLPPLAGGASVERGRGEASVVASMCAASGKDGRSWGCRPLGSQPPLGRARCAIPLHLDRDLDLLRLYRSPSKSQRPDSMGGEAQEPHRFSRWLDRRAE